MVQVTEQWLSGCAASFMAFYHHLEHNKAPSTHSTALLQVQKGMNLFFFILTIILNTFYMSGSPKGLASNHPTPFAHVYGTVVVIIFTDEHDIHCVLLPHH